MTATIHKLPDNAEQAGQAFISAAAVLLREADLTPKNADIARAVTLIHTLCRDNSHLSPDILDFTALPGPNPQSELINRFLVCEQELEKHYARLIIARGMQRDQLSWEDLRIYPWFKTYPSLFDFEFNIIESAVQEMPPLSSVGFIGAGALPVVPMMLRQVINEQLGVDIRIVGVSVVWHIEVELHSPPITVHF